MVVRQSTLDPHSAAISRKRASRGFVPDTAPPWQRPVPAWCESCASTAGTNTTGAIEQPRGSIGSVKTASRDGQAFVSSPSRPAPSSAHYSRRLGPPAAGFIGMTMPPEVMAQAINDGIPKLRIEEAAARAQARIDSGTQPVIGINKYQVEEDQEVEVLKVENSRVRAEQLAKLEDLRANRDQSAVEAALAELSRAAAAHGRAGEDGLGNNLLALAVDAPAARPRSARSLTRSIVSHHFLHLQWKIFDHPKLEKCQAMQTTRIDQNPVINFCFQQRDTIQNPSEYFHV